MSATTAHVCPNALLQLLLCEVMTPQQIAKGLLILPDDHDYLIYMGTRSNRAPGHSTLPDEDGSSRLLRSIRARTLAAKDDRLLASKGIQPDVSFVDGLDRLAETVVLARDQQRLLWYPKNLVHRWLIQVHRDPEWWNTVLRSFPGSRFPRDPHRLAMYPENPKSWSHLLRIYAGIETNHMPPQTFLGSTQEPDPLPALESLSA